MKGIELDEFYNFTLLSGLNLSPDGKSLTFVYSKANKEDNKYDSNLAIFRNNKIVNLISDGKVEEYFFEDNDSILFSAKREEKDKDRKDDFTTLYRLSLSGGEAVKAYEFPLEASSFKKLDNGDYLFIGLIDKRYPDYYLLSEDKRKEFLEAHKEDKDYEELDESPFFQNGDGFINSKRSALFYFDIKNNKIKRLTDKYFDVYGFDVRNNDVFISGVSYKNKIELKNPIYKLDLTTKKIVRLIGPELSVYEMKIVNNKLMVVGSDCKKYGINENPKFYILDEINNKLLLINDADLSTGLGTLTDVEYGSTRTYKSDSSYLYFLAIDGTNNVLKRIDTSGNIETVVKTNGSITDFDVLNGKIYVMGMIGLKLQEIYEYNGELKQITHYNVNVLSEKYLSKPEYILTNYENEDIDGWVLKPINYDSSKTYPAILDIHGGPKCAYGEIFFHEMQYWASKGYFVMYCNPHGSDGKGNEFAYLDMKWGSIDYAHIMAFVDNVLTAYPNIDKKRVCCTGGSYGGYMCNWIMGHTDRFCAIATQRSISNWITMYGVSDISPVACSETCDANPYSKKGFKEMWDVSPLKYVNNAKTPTIFIHSDEDHRCPIDEGYQLFTALVYKGVPARMVVFHGENHELSRTGKPHHRIKRLDEITKWFDKYTNIK